MKRACAMTLTLLQGYLSRITQCANDLNITDEEVSALFGNIEAIYEFNRYAGSDVLSLYSTHIYTISSMNNKTNLNQLIL